MRFWPQSFKALIIAIFVFVFLILGVGLLAMGFVYHQVQLRNLQTAQRTWIDLYSQTLLEDLKIGNVTAVEKKLKDLVTRGNLKRVRLTFGSQAIVAEESESDGLRSHSTTLLGLEKWVSLLPPTEVTLSLSDRNKTLWGAVALELDPRVFYMDLYRSLESIWIHSLALVFLLSALVLWLLDKRMAELKALEDHFLKFSYLADQSERLGELLDSPPEVRIKEWRSLLEGFQGAIHNIIRLQERVEASKLEAAVSKIARQVAHDIRSPLAALNMSIDMSGHEISEEAASIIRAAIQRIEQMAADLLVKKSSRLYDAQGNVENAGEVIQKLVAEKRLEFRNRPDVELRIDLTPSTLSARLPMRKTDFERVLSNILNNCYEALAGQGEIMLKSRIFKNNLQIEIADSGCGIPPEILNRVFDLHFSHGKESGTGMGLANAKQKIQDAGGSISIASRIGEGTQVYISMPVADDLLQLISPKVLLEQQIERIIVVDDDPSIYQCWKRRFSIYGDEVPAIEYFARASDFEDRLRDTSLSNQRVLFLIDQDLGSGATGVELIERYGLSLQAYLVTSGYDDSGVRAQCARAAIRIIPKTKIDSIAIERKARQ